MNINKLIIDHLAAQTTLAPGVDLFQGRFPSPARNGVVLWVSGGTENDTGLQRYTVGANTQYDDYDTACDILTNVYNVLAYSNGFTISGIGFFNSIPLSLPKYITTTNENKVVFACSFVCITPGQ